MNASAATADTPLRQAGMLLSRMPAGRLALCHLDILCQVCLGVAGLRVPVSRGVWAVS